MAGLNKSTILIVVICSMVFASCNHVDEDTAAEQAKTIKYATDNGYSKLPSGVYIKFFNHTTENDTFTPLPGQTLIIDYTGRDLDGNLLETTNEELGSSNFPDLYFVYGPFRTRKGNTKRGLDTALYYFNIGDSASVLIPLEWWNNDIPVVYNVKLLDYIFNDSAHAEMQFYKFIDTNGFDTAVHFGNHIPYKLLSSSINPDLDNPFKIKSQDTVVISLTAQYAEDYNGTGRIFYPLCNAPQEFLRIYGDDYSFPVIPEVDTAIKHMNKGDKLEIVVPFNFAYGITGFNNPVYGVTIVPPFMPVHYTIELLDTIPGK